MKHLRLLTILTGFLASSLLVQAQGLIGTNHIHAGGGYSSGKLNIQGLKIDSDSGYNLALGGNFALYNEYTSDYGLDLLVGVGYSKLKKDDTYAVWGTIHNGSISGTGIQTALRPYIKLNDQFKLFVNAGLGWWHSKYKESARNPSTGAHVSVSNKEDGFAWGLGAGVEFVIDAFSVQGTVTYIDGFDSKISSSWNFGLGANYWLNETWGLGADYGYSDSDDKGSSLRTHAISGFVRLRF